MDFKKQASRNAVSAGPDKVRLISMVVLLIIVATVFILTQRESTRNPGPMAGDGFEPVRPEVAPPASKVDPAELVAVQDATRDDRGPVEPEALLHLLFEANKSVPGDFRRLEARWIDAQTYEEIVADPAPHRGRPFFAKAMVSAILRQTVVTRAGSGPDESLDYWTVVGEDLDSRAYCISMLNEPEGVEVGDVVRMEGFFLKKRALFAGESPETLVDPTLQLVGKRATPSFFRMDPVTVLEASVFDGVADYEIEDKLQIEKKPLYSVLSFLQNVSGDELDQVAHDVTSYALRSDPDRWRGLPVRVLGTFYGEMWGHALGPEGENPLDLRSVQHGLLVHSGPTFTYLISMDEEPDWLKPGDAVIVQGIFLKRYVYQTDGGQTQDCPLLIVKRFEPYEFESDKNAEYPAYVITGIGVLFIGWFLVSAFGDRKATLAYRRRFYEARKRQLREQYGGSESEGSA